MSFAINRQYTISQCSREKCTIPIIMGNHSFAMSLVSSSKFLYGKDIPVQKYSQLTSVFNHLELYNLMTTSNGNRGRVFLLCRLYEDIPLFFYVASEVVHKDFGDV